MVDWNRGHLERLLQAGLLTNTDYTDNPRIPRTLIEYGQAFYGSNTKPIRIRIQSVIFADYTDILLILLLMLFKCWGAQRLRGLEAGRLAGWKARRLGGWEAWRLEGEEAGGGYSYK